MSKDDCEHKAKKLMLLGGLRYLIPVIETAHRLGIYVITVDYLPENIAHKYSDEYYNYSILEKDDILELAQKLEIDGIMSFAVDPGVVTAAYVAEKMGLPFQGSYQSVSILQDKAKFRAFLSENGFNVPRAKGYTKIEDALKEKNEWHYPVIVKPVDSAGSKGVSKVNNEAELNKAINLALTESHIGHFIIEEFIVPIGHPSDSDSFTINGELTVCTFSDQGFDKNAENPYTPSSYSWPSTMEQSYQTELKSELQRLMNLLEMQTGVYNIETRVGEDKKAYIMEVSPRGGGNRLAEMTDMEYGTNMIENSVRNAVGLPLLPIKIKKADGCLVEIIIHSTKTGVFEKLEVNKYLYPFLKQLDLWVKEGDKVNSFQGANNSIGTMVLKFPDSEKIREYLSDPENFYKIIYK